MRISEVILQKILTDSTFSRDLSAVLGIKQMSVERAAQRVRKDSVKNYSLSRPEAILFYKEQGFSEDEIFEKAPAL